MDWRIIAGVLINTTLITNCLAAVVTTQTPSESTPTPTSYEVEDLWWTQAGRSLGLTIRDCLTVMSPTPQAPRNVQIRNQMAILSSCLKHYAQTTLKALLSDDVIPIVEGIELVKINGSEIKRASRADSSDRDSGDASLSAWRNMLIDSLADVFDTHAIRISMHELQVANSNSETARRRKRNHMMPLMVFGLVGLGMILIPMGFQFLAVLGGKALLLAKMALILTSIQGLKKVAHSNINYGLYHSAPANPWYDRKAEDSEHLYKTEDTYYNYSPYPEQVVEYKRYPRP